MLFVAIFSWRDLYIYKEPAKHHNVYVLPLFQTFDFLESLEISVKIFAFTHFWIYR